MNTHKAALLFLFIAPLVASSPADAQVDAIPDPHQDFYQMRQPKKVLQPSQLDAQSGKDFSDQNSVDLNGFRGQAPSQLRKANPSADELSGTAPRANDLNDSIMQTMPPQAPDFRNSDGSQTDQSLQPPPTFTHPELLPRPPIPAPPAVTLLPPLNGGQVKDSLSWRTRAFKIRSESADVKGGLVKSSRVVNAAYEDTLAALSTVCSSRGIVIDSIFESSGQVLAHQSDGGDDKSRIIFSLKPVSKSSTLIRVGLDADSRARQASFDELLNRVETAANEKGLL